mgnify:CR=1 FL=1
MPSIAGSVKIKSKKWINGRNFVVSGASSGIGRLLTEKLIDCGCTVTGIGRSEKKFDDFKLSLGGKSANLNVEIFDVTEEREWEALAKRLEEKYGKIDGVINCAGIFPPFKKTVACTSEETESVIKTNFLSAVYSINNLFSLIERSDSPAIVNVSSASALATIVGTAGDSASKSALKSYTEVLAEELRGKVYVGLVMPGFARTDIFRMQNTKFDENKLLYLASMSAEKMSAKIFRGILKKKRKMIIGKDAKAMNFFFRLMPKTTSRIVSKILKKSKMRLFDDIFN